MAWWEVSCRRKVYLFPSGTHCIARFSLKPTVWAAPSRSTRAPLYETTIVSYSLNEVATLAHVIPQMRQFTNIIFSGVMNKLKKLRLGFLEAGCGWAPFLISKIEERLERVSPNERPVLPSELLARKQFFFQCGEESTTKRDVELLGDGCLLWASDFPHEATRTNLHALVKEFFDRKDLPAAAKNKIARTNPKRFYAL
jgi:uncharacterized protein